MKPCFIYFNEIALSNDKFTSDFSDQELVQEIDFLSNNDCYITSEACKLKVKKKNIFMMIEKNCRIT